MKLLVTGAAGFIGSYVCRRLLERGDEVVALDNINSYYDVNLKYGRLETLGIGRDQVAWYKFVPSTTYARLRFIRMNLEDRQAMEMLMSNEQFEVVVNLAAQAGVRYSIENPYAYVESNVDGFLNILEGCRHHAVKHLVYASSSSVYGMNGAVPFSEHDSIAHPVSLYAATKKANELMAHTYSHLYGIPSTGLRFFTVYGPWGRPDMSPFLFADAILHGRAVKVFNNGDMLRDFTYIDDIVEGVLRVIDHIPAGNDRWNSVQPDPATSTAPYKIYNIGNSQPVKLMDFIGAIEEAIGHPAEKIFLPMQPGDVYQTNADTTALQQELGFKPDTPIGEGVRATIEWYRSFYHLPVC
ncbi:MAG: NAD-dependent epimerase [Prevotellaceae bacterium]|jgi:UDP-glucuronate 4-epimerase|nr:NAD-dependent epimerase [Prevotellaceae bacterium]